MLCDDILADFRLPVEYPGFDKMQALIKGASKYVLAPDFTAAADGLINNLPELTRIVPFCRLPSASCWFELAQADRPHFMAAPMHYEALQSRPKRVGFLCHAQNPSELWDFDVVLCWSLTAPKFGGPHNVSAVSVWFNTEKEISSDRDELARHFEICIAPFCPPSVRGLISSDTEFRKVMQSDWGGEVRYLLAMLGLFNARNVVEIEKVVRSHNKTRMRTGKLPFCSHTLLKIRAMHRRSLVGARGQGSSNDVREHFVSGHWKARRTGLFWWNPFWRGNPERGRINHDYEVTT